MQEKRMQVTRSNRKQVISETTHKQSTGYANKKNNSLEKIHYLRVCKRFYH